MTAFKRCRGIDIIHEADKRFPKRRGCIIELLRGIEPGIDPEVWTASPERQPSTWAQLDNDEEREKMAISSTRAGFQIKARRC